MRIDVAPNARRDRAIDPGALLCGSGIYTIRYPLASRQVNCIAFRPAAPSVVTQRQLDACHTAVAIMDGRDLVVLNYVRAALRAPLASAMAMLAGLH